MKCANCEMTNQLPGTKCSHCGKLIPEPKPVTLTAAPEDENAEGKSSGVSAEEGQKESETQTEAAPEEVVPEKGHVDNVGDETETETVVP